MSQAFPRARDLLTIARMSLPSETLQRIITLAAAHPVFLEHLPWPEVAALREENGGLLLLPLGATEQHGPHLPICTDTLIATASCAYASAKTGVPMLPPLAYTVSAGHTAKWPGTFSLLHETFIASLRQLAAWCAATGWKRLLLVNSHFGNDASMRVAVDQIRLEHLGRLQIAARSTYQLTPEIWQAFIADAEDLHANKAETDLLLHLAPELVRMDQLSTADDPDRTTGTVFSYPVAQTSLNGVTGFPSRATAADGAVLFQQIGDALAMLVERARTDEPPLASEHWADVPRLVPGFFDSSHA
jgi:creatinine amidohydrolase